MQLALLVVASVMVQHVLGQEEESEIDSPLVRQRRDLEMAASGVGAAGVGAVAGFKGGKVKKIIKVW